jgi:hypothetical protein
MECKAVDGKPPGSRPSLASPLIRRMMPIYADHSLSGPGSAAICSIRLICGETLSETRGFEVAQSLFGLTLEMVELVYMLLLLNQVILGKVAAMNVQVNSWSLNSN